MIISESWYREESVTLGRSSKRAPIFKTVISTMMDEITPATCQKHTHLVLSKWCQVEHMTSVWSGTGICAVCAHMCMCIYLCLAPCALLDEAARQGGGHGVALKKAADSVTETQSNQLLEKETAGQAQFEVITYTFRLKNRWPLILIPILDVNNTTTFRVWSLWPSGQ